MQYVALLRGINVGGHNKVDMKTLVAALEKDGFDDVSYYLNTGNIFFESTKTPQKITEQIEKLIQNVFALDIKVLVRDKKNINDIVSSIPPDWINDKETRCNVMFLWEKYNDPSILDQLNIQKDIDDAYYQSGGVVWRFLQKNFNKSGIKKLVGTDIYRNMTIRNVNTTRKIAERMPCR